MCTVITTATKKKIISPCGSLRLQWLLMAACNSFPEHFHFFCHVPTSKTFPLLGVKKQFLFTMRLSKQAFPQHSTEIDWRDLVSHHMLLKQKKKKKHERTIYIYSTYNFFFLNERQQWLKLSAAKHNKILARNRSKAMSKQYQLLHN